MDSYLSFEVQDEVLHVHANADALEYLVHVLDRLAKAARRGYNEDAHLFAESWGGHDLCEIPLIPEARAVKQVNFVVILEPPARAV